MDKIGKLPATDDSTLLKRELLRQLLEEEGIEAQKGQSIPATPRSGDDLLPLSFAQQRLWFLDRLEQNSTHYNIPFMLRLIGALDADALVRCFNTILRRHESLRATFHEIDGRPVQLISSEARVDLEVEDLSAPPLHEREDEPEARVKAIADEEAARPFDLSQGPLWRIRLIRRESEDHILLLTMHHIVSDGWSMGVFMQEMAALYEAFSKGRPSPLDDLPIQYADYAMWQRERLSGDILDRELAYWRKQLSGAPLALDLPTDYSRPAVQKHRGACRSVPIAKSVGEKLVAISRRENATLFMTMLAAFNALLRRYTGEHDITIGSPIAGRTSPEIEGLIGFFVNTLALRVDLPGDPTFLELLRRVRETAISAYAHQELPFEKLLEELSVERDLSRHPLFQVAFVMQNTPFPALNLPGVSIEPMEIENHTAKFDLTLSIEEAEDGLKAYLEYDTDLFADSTIVRSLTRFEILLSGIVENPQRRISELPLLSEAEYRLLLAPKKDSFSHRAHRDHRACDGSVSSVTSVATACLHRLFEAQAARAPDAVALVFEEEMVTYCALNRRANQTAHYLRRLGVGPETPVGLMMERSSEGWGDMIVGLIGILKAGGAYVPLDPTYPHERLAFMLEDTHAPVLLTQRKVADRLSERGVREIYMDADWELIAAESGEDPLAPLSPENPAYVIYTSGSTGKPKGVVVSHNNVARLFTATQPWFHFESQQGRQDVWTLFHSYAFDFSVWEIWGALLYGGKLVVVPYWVSRTPESFYDLLVEEQVTVLNQTPSAFRQLIRIDSATAQSRITALRYVIFGGEALDLKGLSPWFDRHRDTQPQLVNMYGITETCVHVTYRPLTADDLAGGSMIGVSIPDLSVYALDRHLQPVPFGVSGEIYVGGRGLSRGYLNRPELTAERFLPNPFGFKPGERLYRAGDRARFLPDGDIEYLGRLDYQVKIKGFRIELQEIEAVIKSHSGTSECVVIVREDAPGDKLLVAYIVADHNAPPTRDELRLFVRERLPDYMAPSLFIFQDELPLTAQGKIDRRALLRQDYRRDSLTADTFVAPRNEVETILAEVWAEALGVERVGIDDNYFALGGDSIRSIRVRARATERGLKFSLQQLFQYQTIRELSLVCETVKPETSITPPFSLISAEDRARLAAGATDIEDAYPLSHIQAGLVFHSEYSRDYIVYLSSFHIRAPFDAEKLRESLQYVRDRHAIMRTSYNLTDFNEPLQLVHRKPPIPLAVEDLRHLPGEEMEACLSSWMETEMRNRFDWAEPPLFRFRVHLRKDDEFQFTMTEPTIDGWSVASLVTELFERYFAILENGPLSPEPPLRSSYADFIRLERNALADIACRNFWEEKLRDAAGSRLPRPRGVSPTMREGVANQAFPHDRATAASRTDIPRVGRIDVTLQPAVYDRLWELAREFEVPLKSLLLAAHLKVVGFWSGKSDIFTGLFCNGRPEEADGERVLGVFLNIPPFHFRLGGGNWEDLARAVFDAEREMLPFRRYPIQELHRIYQAENLFDTSFNYTHFHVYRRLQSVEGLAVLSHFGTEQTYYALTAQFNVAEATSEIFLGLDYREQELSRDQVEAIAETYLTVLDAIVRDPRARHESLCLLPERERRQILYEWNATDVEYPAAGSRRERCVHELFEEQVQKTLDAVALAFENDFLSYAELNRRANQLAHYLRRWEIGPEALVGMCVERSVEMMVGLLGILKAGAAYVPLEPSYPAERLTEMLEDSATAVVLTHAQAPADIRSLLTTAGMRVINLDADAEHWEGEPATKPDPGSLGLRSERTAYVIYTSGSTGKPKGVMNEHRAVVNRLLWMQEAYGLDRDDVVLQKTPFSFDVSVWEFFWPLLRGAKLVLARAEGHKDPAYLSEIIEQQGITTMHFVPSMLQVFLEHHKASECRNLARVICSGEALPSSLAQRFHARLPDTDLYNLYGPTEAAIDVTAWNCRQGAVGNSIPIGRPVANTRIYILDVHHQPTPIGVAGELHIGGVQVGRGYLDRPELTAERFLPDPFGRDPGARIYKTGDLGHWLPDGNIQFLGRSDFQVKIRGFRIELGEIEAVLRQHLGVQEAVVLAKEYGPEDKRLIAYLVPDQQRAFTLRRLLRLERQGPLSNKHELPNGMLIIHVNKGETDFMYKEIFEERTYAKHGIILNEESSIFDVGANIGLFTLFAGLECRNAVIYAFEPIPQVFDVLRMNAELYGLNVKLFNCGLSDAPKHEAVTYYPKISVVSGLYADDREQQEIIKSFLFNQERSGSGETPLSNGKLLDELLEERLASERITCQFKTISDVIRENNVERIDLLKIDVEKSELDVLGGIQENDWKKIRQCVVEVHDINGRLEHITLLFKNHGYNVIIQQDALLKDTGMYNVYAIRSPESWSLPSEASNKPIEMSRPVWHSQSGLIRDVRQFLTSKLPDYMAPAAIVTLDALPLTPNGKLDRKGLPAPEVDAYSRRGYEAPQGETETLLAAIWAELLKLERVGRHDNFFELGGHSLLATQLVSRIRDAFYIEASVRDLFETPTVEALGRRIEQSLREGQGLDPVRFVAEERPERIPLSFAQQRLWFLDQLEPGSSFYNIPLALRLSGPLNVQALERSISEIIRRHETLRTSFHGVERHGGHGGGPAQFISDAAPMTIPIIDISPLPAWEREAEAERQAHKEAQRPFDLSAGPLIRVILLRLNQNSHALLITMHHIISDGWSVGIMLSEMAALYRAFSSELRQDLQDFSGFDSTGPHPEKSSLLPELPIQYADFAIWQRRWLSGEQLHQQLYYWKRQLEGAPSALDLPTDRPYPPVRTFRGAKYHFLLSEALLEEIKAVNRSHGVTLFMTLLAAFKTLLYRYTGQGDIVIGSPIAGRNWREIENLIGFFVNTLVLRSDLGSVPRFSDLLGRVRETALGAYAHQDLPFEKLVEELQPERNLSHTPLFQVMFALENMALRNMESGGVQIDPMGIDSGGAKFDLTLLTLESQDGIDCVFEYNTDIFEEGTVARSAGHFRTLLEAVVKDPQQRVSDIPLLTKSERDQLLIEWNRTCVGPPPFLEGKCIHVLFEEQAARTPDAVVVVSGSEQITYGSLNERAGELAQYLRDLGIATDAPIGLCTGNSFEMLIGIMGILKAGGSYLPLDPSYPHERLAFMLRDAGATALLRWDRLQSVRSLNWGGQTEICPTPGLRIARLDTAVGACLKNVSTTERTEGAERDGSVRSVIPVTTLQNPAYAIYTSGSTGTPKGVVVTHSNLAHSTLARVSYYREPVGRFLLLSSVAFDSSVAGIFWTLITGGTLVLPPEESTPDAETQAALIASHGVTHLLALPTLYRLILEYARPNQLSSLRTAIVAGEACTEEVVNCHRAAAPQSLLFNEYGPSEATVWSSVYDCSSEPHLPRVPIGRPIANTQIYILDANLQPVPVGVSGEIYIGGSGLTNGYLNRPDLTAERFIPAPPFLYSSPRLYKTGDIGRYMAYGNIEFIGRADHQIKLRGFRIELEEIEAVLKRHDSVRDAVVSVREDVPGLKRLVAYVVCDEATNLQAVDLIAYLKERLPNYMVPSACVLLEALPLAPNGKPDRNALPPPERLLSETEERFVAPRTRVETVVAGIWAKTLGAERIGVNDNFFGLGGHSLLAVQMVYQARESLRVELPMRTLFEAPTVADFAREIERLLEIGTTRSGTDFSPSAPIHATDRLKPVPLSFAQERLWFLNQLEPGNPFYNIPAALRLRGRLRDELLKETLESLIARHESLRTGFRVIDDRPRQIIDHHSEVPWSFVDLSDRPDAEAVVGPLASKEARHAFALDRPPLLRVALYRIGDDDHVLLMNMHHIISDAQSVATLTREIGVVYRALTEGASPELPNLRVQYADYAVWQRKWLEGENLERELNYWRAKLAGVPASLELPADRPRPAAQSHRGANYRWRLDAELSDRIRRLGRGEGATLFMTLLAAWQLLLARYSGQEDLLVGTPIANRTRTELEGVIGFFTNTLALRATLADAATFREFLSETRRAALEAYAHQEAPFERLVEELRPDRDLSRSPLFQVMFLLENTPAPELQIAGLEIEEMELSTGVAKFDLILAMAETPAGIAASIEYNTDLFDSERIERMANHSTLLLEGVASDPDRRVSEISLLSAAEITQILEEWGGAERQFDKRCVHELFERQAESAPDAVAVIYGAQWVTYRELNARANQLAHRLRREGVGPDAPVGLLMERSIEIVIALLGALKAGGAYVPIDIEYPPERIAFIMKDVRAPLLITQERFVEGLPAGAPPLVCLDTDWGDVAGRNSGNLAAPISPDNLAYISYTSGSTGLPKGIAVPHRSLIGFMVNVDYVRFDSSIRSLQHSSISWDALTLELWPALIHGGCCILYPGRVPAPSELERIIKDYDVNTLWITSSLFNALMDTLPEALSGVGQVMTGGEALSEVHVRRALKLLPETHLVNGYGPSECVVFTCCYPIPKDLNEHARPIPIGKPIGDRLAYVLDRWMTLAQAEAEGELYVGGDSLARGYLGRPELTAERFVPHPYNGRVGERLYRTGDVVRRRADGLIEFVGRLLPELPLKSTGKIDRQVLSTIKPAENEAPGEFVRPRTAIEEVIADIWAEVLRTTHFGVHDNFFELGGHSLLAVHLVSRVREVMQAPLPVRCVFETPTVAGMASRISALTDDVRIRPFVARKDHGNSPLAAIQPNGSRPPFFCVHPADGNVFCYVALSRMLGSDQPFYGLQSPGLDDDEEPYAEIEAAATGYITALRSVQPKGPYRLGGWSMGGVIAFEMARQLLECGEQVSRLILIDSFLPARGEAIIQETDQALLAGFAMNLGLSIDHLAAVREELRLLGPDEQLSQVLEMARESKLVPPDINFSTIRRLRYVYDANVRAVNKYAPQTVAVQVTLLKASEPLSTDTESQVREWERWATLGVKVYEAPGNHFDMLREPNLKFLAKTLMQSALVADC